MYLELDKYWIYLQVYEREALKYFVLKILGDLSATVQLYSTPDD